MKTIPPKQPATQQNQQRFSKRQLRVTQPTQPAKSKEARKWLKVIEFATVGFATWLNPNAGFLIFLLKLCFQILVLLQDEQEQ